MTTGIADGRTSLLGVRGRLYVAFAALGVLALGSVVGAVAWVRIADTASRAQLLAAEQALLATETARLDMMTMSDAMRGVLLNPRDDSEVKRKHAAHAALSAAFADVAGRVAASPVLSGQLRKI